MVITSSCSTNDIWIQGPSSGSMTSGSTIWTKHNHLPIMSILVYYYYTELWFACRCINDYCNRVFVFFCVNVRWPFHPINAGILRQSAVHSVFYSKVEPTIVTWGHTIELTEVPSWEKGNHFIELSLSSRKCLCKSSIWANFFITQKNNAEPIFLKCYAHNLIILKATVRHSSRDVVSQVVIDVEKLSGLSEGVDELTVVCKDLNNKVCRNCPGSFPVSSPHTIGSRDSPQERKRKAKSKQREEKGKTLCILLPNFGKLHQKDG